MTPFRVEVTTVGRFHLVAVAGEIDIATAPQIRQAIADLACTPDCDVIVDLASVTFIDAAGLSVLMFARRILGDGARLHLVGTPPRVSRLLRLTGLAQLFPSTSSVSGLLASSGG